VDPDGNFQLGYIDPTDISPFVDPRSYLFEYGIYDLAMPTAVAAVLAAAEAAAQQAEENFITEEQALLSLFPPLKELQYSIVDNATAEATELMSGNGPCASAVNKLLSDINNSMRTNFNVNSLIGISNSSSYYSSSSQLQVTGSNGNQTTIANEFTNNGYLIAVTNLTLYNTPAIFLGSNFFSDPNVQAYTLIHEWFHGLNVPQFTDQFLSGLLGWNSQSAVSASTFLSNYFANNCSLGS
jgi:hypothetical protein